MGDEHPTRSGVSDTRVSVYCTAEDLVRIDVARGDMPRSTFLRELLGDDLAQSERRPLQESPTPLPRALTAGRISVRVPDDMLLRLRARVGPGGSIPGHARDLIPAPAPAPSPGPRRDRANLRKRLAQLRRRALGISERKGLRGTRAMLELRGTQPEGTMRLRIASAEDLPLISEAVRATANGAELAINLWPTSPTDLDVLERDALAETTAAAVGASIRIERRVLTWRASGVEWHAVNLRLRLRRA